MTDTRHDSQQFLYGSEIIHAVDCDAHWAEPPDLWTSRAPAKYRDVVPQVHRNDKGEDNWYVGSTFLSSFPSTVIDRSGNKFANGTFIKRYEDAIPGAFDTLERVKVMDAHGIWAQVVYPNVAGFAGRVVGTGSDLGPDFELFCVQAYNDGAAEMQQVSGHRVLPMGVLPIFDMDKCVVEMRRCHEELGLKGFVIGNPVGMGLPDYTSDYWTPFFQYCDANRIPLNFHLGASGINTRTGIWPTYGPPPESPLDWTTWSGQYLAITTIAGQTAMSALVANFMYSEIHDKYPNVKFVLVESGLGWIPFLLEALEYQLDETVPANIRRGQLRPKEYFKRNWYSMFWFETYAPKYMLEEIGVHNVLAETDFPHPTCLFPNNRSHMTEVLSSWDAYTRGRVLRDNAAELYKIDVPET